MVIDFLCYSCGTYFIEQVSSCTLTELGISCPKCGSQKVVRLELSSHATGG